MSRLESLRDSELVSRAQQDDDAAFGALVTRHRPKLHKFVNTILHDQDQSEDVVQDTFLSAYLRRADFNPDNSFEGWVRIIARNTALSELRRRKTRLGNGGNQLLFSLPDPKPTPDELCETRDTNHLVRREVGQLPPKFRKVLILRNFQESDYELMAALAKCSLSTVKVQTFRARQALRARIEHRM